MITNDTLVTFHEKVFSKALSPYYGAYLGHVFKVTATTDNGHVKLMCVSNEAVLVDGMVHEDELVVLE